MSINFNKWSKTILYTCENGNSDLQETISKALQESYNRGYTECKNTDWWKEQDAEKSK